MSKILPGNLLIATVALFGSCAVHAQMSALPTTPIAQQQPVQGADTQGVALVLAPQLPGIAMPAAQTAPAATAQPVDDDVAPQAPITPNIDHEVVSSDDIYTVYLRPLYSTMIKLPEEVTSLTVGAPTLISAEHDKNEPKLISIKPTTDSPIDSNIIVAMVSGQTLAIHVISAGDKGSDDPVDFVVDYSQSHSLMLGQSQQSKLFRSRVGETLVGTPPTAQDKEHAEHEQRQQGPTNSATQSPLSTEITDFTPVAHLDHAPLHRARGHSRAPAVSGGATGVADEVVRDGEPQVAEVGSSLGVAYREQVTIGAPHYTDANELSHVYPLNKNATTALAVALGQMTQQGDTVIFAYSVMNRSARWIEIMPPLLQFNDPNGHPGAKENKKHPTTLAEQLPVDDYIMSGTKLAPGQRMDGAVQFDRPSFKYKNQALMLAVASASEVDTALFVPVPFIAAKEH
jgi:hypothetical protein